MIQEIVEKMKEDENYAWAWHSMFAMCSYDKGLAYQLANQAAAQMMLVCFNIDTTKFEMYKTTQGDYPETFCKKCGEKLSLKRYKDIIEQDSHYYTVNLLACSECGTVNDRGTFVE